MEVKVKKPKVTAVRTNGTLSFRQIRNRVGNGWAIIKDPEFNGCILLGGKLLYHSNDRIKALDEFEKCDNGHFAFKYCGKLDPNAIYLL